MKKSKNSGKKPYEPNSAKAGRVPKKRDGGLGPGQAGTMPESNKASRPDAPLENKRSTSMKRRDQNLRPSGPARPQSRASAGGGGTAGPERAPARPTQPAENKIYAQREQRGCPEILAPAGSKATWAAAVESGADAVYLGLNNFSARTYADNFSMAELASVIRQSHQAGVKIYLALNSLIKEEELNAAWKLLASAAALGPDAFIIQDLGLGALAAKYFPEIPRHASTLTAVHSLPGLMVLQEAGYSRAVLARELAFDEVRALSIHSPIEVEIFIHGALCFSFSGLCLMSSFLGGRSALRGGCTQPCRRNYSRSGRKGAFFSTTDLCTARYLRELRELPISTFKIEGRMKGPDYVSRVVRAYRLLMDAPDADWPYALAEAENILLEAPSRRTTGGPLAAEVEGALAPLSATTSGLKLGWMDPEGPGTGRVLLDRPVEVNDRLRLQPKAGEESAAFNLKSIIQNGMEIEKAPAGAEVILGGPNLPDQKGFLFKVSSGNEERKFLASPLVKKLKEDSKNFKPAAPRPLPAELTQRVAGRQAGIDPVRAGLWLWLDKAEDMRDLTGLEYKKVILPLTTPNLKHISHNRRHIKNELAKIVWSLPPLIFHQKQALLMKEARKLIEGGSREFLVSNLGQINMLKRAGREFLPTGPPSGAPPRRSPTGAQTTGAGGPRSKSASLLIWGDHRLGVLNHLTETVLTGLGLNGITLSLEADADTYKALWKKQAAGQRLLYIYGHPALFTARYPLDQRKNAIISPKGEKFYLGLEGDQTIVTSEKAVFIAQLLKMPPLSGAAGLIVDLRMEKRPGLKLKELKKALAGGRLGQGSSFNFKRSLM